MKPTFQDLLFVVSMTSAAACGSKVAPHPTLVQHPCGAVVPGTAPEGSLWHTSIDLDGDGTDELAFITSKTATLASQTARANDSKKLADLERLPIAITCQRGTPCTGVITVGQAPSQPITLSDGYFGGLAVKVVDTDKTTPSKEVLITQRIPGEREDPPFVFTLVTYDGNKTAAHKLFHTDGYNSGAFTTDGNGTFTLVYNDCPNKTTVTYRLSGMKLQLLDKKVEPSPKYQGVTECPG